MPGLPRTVAASRFAAALLILCPLLAYGDPKTESPLQPFGLDRFPPLYAQAVQVFTTAEAQYRRQDFAAARQTLEALWREHPEGSRDWKELQKESVPLHSVADFGSPPAYAALRMLTACALWRTAGEPAVTRTNLQVTVVLVGRSEGLAPQTRAELRSGAGRPVVHTLDTALSGADGEKVLDEAYWLFEEYLLAMTGGHIGLKRVLVRLPDLEVPVGIHDGGIELTRATTQRIWAAVPESVARKTAWWHVIYPSHVPVAPVFADQRFVTGGMRAGPDGTGAMCFVSEDLKLLRSPNQDGHHLLTVPERRIALPQWFQHEFFHYLFHLYPSLKLEARSHQWHDRKSWPDDFEGVVEADYYDEALQKRLLKQRAPSLVEKLLHPAR
jgi:hypothetical protein